MTTKQKMFFILPTLIVCFALFFIGGPDYGSIRSFKHFWNLGHIVFFALFTYALLNLSRTLSSRPFAVQFTCVIGLTLLIGVMVEAGQYGLHRSPDTHDLIRNLIGSSFALFFLTPSRKTISASMGRTAQCTVIIMIVLEIIPLIISLTDEVISKKQFPLLAGFEYPTEIHRWSGNSEYAPVEDHAAQGKRSLKINLNTDTYSGVSINYFPGDWSRYNNLRFHIYNPSHGDPIRLTTRIHDRQHTEGIQRYHDRFNKSFSVKQGWNTIEIPLDAVINAPKGRIMDITAIRSFMVFAVRLKKPQTIYLDDVRLAE